ncbi:MAG: MobA/MobL family protein [Enterococcus sp.]|nr:MobA/MobL family protein [Enterococcus sp.]
MAIFHSTAKVCSTSAKAKIDYISRSKKYSHSKKAEELVHFEEHNLPKWAKNSRDFFAEMDKQELSKQEKEYKALSPADREKKDKELEVRNETLKRKVKCREIEFSLPVELNGKEEMIKFAREYCKEIMGDNHVYAFAIHENEGAMSGNKNPHVHLVYSDRLIEHDREVKREDFCRQRTGYKKDIKMVGKDRAKWVDNNRAILADKINHVLESQNKNTRVSHKSYKDRGLEITPTFHLGHEVVGMLKGGKIPFNKLEKFERFSDAFNAQIEDRAKIRIAKETEHLKVSFSDRLKAGGKLVTAPFLEFDKKDSKESWVNRQKNLVTGNRSQRKEIENTTLEKYKEWGSGKLAEKERNLTSDPIGKYRTYNKANSSEFERRREIYEQEQEIARQEKVRQEKERKEREWQAKEEERKRQARERENQYRDDIQRVSQLYYKFQKAQGYARTECGEELQRIRDKMPSDLFDKAVRMGANEYNSEQELRRSSIEKKQEHTREQTKERKKSVEKNRSNTGMSR